MHTAKRKNVEIRKQGGKMRGSSSEAKQCIKRRVAGSWVRTSWSQNPWNTNKQEQGQQYGTNKFKASISFKVQLQLLSTRGPHSTWRPSTGWIQTAWANVPSLSSHPSLSGLKKVCVRSFPSSSGILKGSFLMLSYKFCRKWSQELLDYSAKWAGFVLWEG